MSFDLELTDRRALVTGGTKGRGAPVVAVLVYAGVKVVTTARSAPKALLEGVHFVAADVSTADGCAALAAAVAEQLGGIDIIVNVVGGSSTPAGGFAVIDDDQWSKELNKNLMAAVPIAPPLFPAVNA